MKLAASGISLTVPQGRIGRRPISVANFLKKDREGLLFKKMAEDPVDYGTNSAGFKLQGREQFQGLSVAIENKPGSVRKGKNADGTEWSTTFSLPYGYIEGTKGADGEEIDAYLGPDKEATEAYVVHQLTPEGKHDEDTVMLGFASASAARKAILAHYDNPDLVGDVDTVPMERLQKVVAAGKKITKLAFVGPPANEHYLLPGAQVTGKAANPRRHPGDGPSAQPSTAGLPVTTRSDVRYTPMLESPTATGIGPVKMGAQMTDPSEHASFFYSGFFTELERGLRKQAELVTPEAAQDSLRHLQELQRTRPSGDQLQRGATVGALVGPVAAAMSKTIGGTWKPSAVGNLRELAASSASGAVFGGLMPAVRHKLETNAETGKLEQFNAQPGVRHIRIPSG